MARIVLVADDSPTIQKKALGILKGQGFEVETVSNGVAAIKRLAVLHPVVVLADVSMPGRDGYEVCEFVKKSPELSQVPVLLVASDMEPYDGPRGEQVGADGIIKKPFEARELISIVEKFAEQFEAATVAIPVAPVAPTAKPESAREFPAFGEEPDVAPTIVQHVEPDFSTHAEGMAFAEPAGEEAHGFSFEPHPADARVQLNAPQADAAIFPEAAFEPPSANAEDQPLAAEAAPAPSPFAPSPPPPYPERAPSFPEGLEATTPEPDILDEQPAQPPEPSHHSFEPPTTIFQAPPEIAQLVWKDETAPAAPAPVSDGPMALEPQYEAEAPVASSELPMEQPSALAPNASVVAATSLDSFSLDDAATGQVHFASEGSEVPHEEAVYFSPRDEVPATEIAPSESVPEVVYSEPAPLEAPPKEEYSEQVPPEIAPEAVHMEAAPGEATPEVVYSKMSPPEAPPEAVNTETAPSEVAPEMAYAETTALGSAPPMVSTEGFPPCVAAEAVSTETAVPDPALETIHPHVAPFENVQEAVETESASPEPVPEGVPSQIGQSGPRPEAIHSEIALPGMVPEAVLTEIALLDAHVEQIHAKIADTETTSEVIPSEISPEEPVPEVIYAHEAGPEATQQVAPTEPATEVAPPPSTLDWDAFYYSIVRKVVVRMSPPVLSAEVVEEIARRLAEEIAAEISSQPSQSPT